MQKHPFHLVNPSPWPIMASLSLWAFAGSLVGWFQGFHYAETLVIISFISLNYVAIVWWRDCLRESVFQGHHTKKVQKGIMYGFLLFIVSEVMLFAGVFWAFGHGSLAPTVDIGVVWPPRGIAVLDPFSIPLLNTIILLTSGASATWAHYAILGRKPEESLLGLFVTISLACIFTGFQLYEYISASFTISDSIYGSCFYLLTGLHGAHVIVGTIFLAVCFFRIFRKHFRTDHHLGFELALIYFHFVDVVWLILFAIVYYWGQ